MKAIYEQELAATARMMLEMPWSNKDFYASYLAQTYHFVAHSTRLLALAGGCARVGEDKIHRHFVSHIGEEKGHDKLALQDLRNLGFTETEAELPATKNLYETQYYKIQFIHPQILNAYILALEGVASQICPKILPVLNDAHGTSTTRFLKLHIEEDPGHVELAFNEIAQVPAHLQAALQDNLVQSFVNYRGFLASVAANAASKFEAAEIKKPVFEALAIEI